MFFSYTQAQTIKGKVVERTQDGKTYEIPGASVFWKDSNTGIVTTANGSFELEKGKDGTDYQCGKAEIDEPPVGVDDHVRVKAE